MGGETERERKAELQAVLVRINASLGDRATWPRYPGGYPGEIEAALLDSVFSLQAVYGSANNGARGVVSRWRAHTGRPIKSLAALL
jgi:hypothetical protein